eukprot:366001-Chlamydomonas_euryale.AAC.13
MHAGISSYVPIQTGEACSTSRGGWQGIVKLAAWDSYRSPAQDEQGNRLASHTLCLDPPATRGTAIDGLGRGVAARKKARWPSVASVASGCWAVGAPTARVGGHLERYAYYGEHWSCSLKHKSESECFP